MDETQEYLVRKIKKYEELNSEVKVNIVYKVIFTAVFTGLTILGIQNMPPFEDVERSFGALFATLASAGFSVSGLILIIKGIAKQLKIYDAIDEAKLELDLTKMEQDYYAEEETKRRYR